MSSKPSQEPERGESQIYHIRIRGHLSSRWTEWFEGLIVTPEENGDTLLSGPIVDQAALHGLLRRIGDVGLPLLSVMRIKTTLEGDQDISRPASWERNSADHTNADLTTESHGSPANHRKESE